ncbi:MAG TPA: alpha/beta hydrolase [Bryobacteraceae bacterium]|jgi:pimeloyl-ACP methyl ester carboxylesterase|nr:alpha/beta hydrolase [Bryobacteraceae bacterium]
MKLFGALLVCASLCLAAPKVEPKTEIGEINGAKFRIDIPDNWNGGLVMYCHGYSPVAGAYKDGKLPPVLAVFTEQGYALAQSGYAAGGWAIQEAVEDTEGLRRYFTGKYGKPKETFITGHSMGGFLAMMFMERFPTSYDAGLALCGPLASATYFMDRGAFDLRVVFDYYFPGALPRPDKVPSDFQNTPELDKKIQALMDSQPEKAAALLHYSGAHSTKDLASTLGFVTYLLLDMEQRGGGNPFDNRNVIYETPDDYNALNDGVKRYKADPRAAEYVRTWYTPTGKLSHPMLAIHTTYDPLVPVRIPARYPELVEQAGSQDLFVQQYVKHDGHCTILPNEIAAGFTELRAWKDQGTKPHSGLHPEMKAAASGQGASGQSQGTDR